MKIVVSSTGPDLQAAVDPRFGRAAFLLLYESDSRQLVEVIDNGEGQDAVQGAGIGVAGRLAEKGVDVILTGRVGPKALTVIDQAGIRVVDNAQGTVAEALAAFLATVDGEKPDQPPQRPAVVPGPGRRAGNQGRGRAGDPRCRSGRPGQGRGRGAGTRERGGCR